MSDPFAYLVDAGWPVERLQWHISQGRTVADVAEAVESMVARGISMEEIIADELHCQQLAGGFEGFEGSGEAENGFSEFSGFSGPDISKNPYFPHDEFSDELRNFSVCACVSLQVPIDMPSVSMLAAMSLCAQRKFRVHPRAKHYEPINVYTAIIAKPSERKSAVIAQTMAPIYRYQREENVRRRARVKEYRDKRDILERRIESIKKSASSGKKAKNSPLGAEEDLRLLRLELENLERDAIDYISLTADDTTMEALTSKMVANGEKMALISSEGGIFNVMSGLYTGGRVNIDLILKAWSGDHVEVDRKGRSPEVLVNPALTINLMTQPKEPLI